MRYANYSNVFTDARLIERITELKNYVFHSVFEGDFCQWHRYTQKGLEPKPFALNLLLAYLESFLVQCDFGWHTHRIRL